MLDSKESKRRSAANEEAVKEQFEKLRYSVQRLDTESSKRKRPDFLVSNTAGCPQLLCEVKTVDSGGFPRDKSVHGVEYVTFQRSMIDFGTSETFQLIGAKSTMVFRQLSISVLY